MSLESSIDRLAAAIEALTAELTDDEPAREVERLKLEAAIESLTAGLAKVAPEVAPEVAATDDVKPFNREDLRSALTKLVQGLGKPDAVAWLQEQCGASKFAEVPDDRVHDVVVAVYERIGPA